MTAEQIQKIVTQNTTADGVVDWEAVAHEINDEFGDGEDLQGEQV